MKKLPIAMVGLNWGRTLILDQFLGGPASKHFELAAVCAKDKDLVDECARQFGVKPCYHLEEILEDGEIPAICLMTGPFGRAELISKAIHAEKHVMTTKPIETDPEAALAVLRTAQNLGRVIHLNSPTPHPSPDIQQILDWKRSLGLGRPIAARADIWANYREVADGSWYDDPATCPVAPILRLGIYLINDLVRLIGRPVAVSVMSSRLFTGRPTADNAQIALAFADGSLATIFSSFCINDAHWWMSSLTLNFENGTVYRNVGPTQGSNPRHHPELSVVTNRSGHQETFRAVAKSSTENYQWDAFHRAILGRARQEEMHPEDVVAAVHVIQAMARSEKSGKTEPVYQA